MTPILVSLIVLCMAGVIGTAIYHALYGSHRALEERFGDLALKVRASQGVFEDSEERYPRLLADFPAMGGQAGAGPEARHARG